MVGKAATVSYGIRLVELSEKEVPALAKAVRKYADAMGLRDYEFEIMHAPPEDEDAFAKIAVDERRKTGKLWVCHGFRALGADFQRHCLVHELVHVHVAEMAFVMRTVEDDLGKLRYQPLAANFLRAEERAVDALATVIASSLPLIEWN